MANTNWKKVWVRKGQENTADLCVLNGHENTNFCTSAPQVVKKICAALKAEDNHSVLEVGCGAGMLAQYFSCDYAGVDYSSSLIQKHKDILGNNVYVAEAADLPFEDNSYDYVFSFSVFHYFSDKEYVSKSIAEMKRVAKRAIFVGDLPTNSFTADHLLFSHREFEGWEISSAFYDRTDRAVRFNILKVLE